MASPEQIAIGLSRFGLAPLQAPAASIEDARAALMFDADNVATPSTVQAALPSSSIMLRGMLAKRMLARAKKAAMGDSSGMMEQSGKDGASSPDAEVWLEEARKRVSLEDELIAALETARREKTGFGERLALHWANQFTVASGKGKARQVIGTFAREVIRPHLLGRFEDMLFAATTHPAMLYYLDNAGSIGPGSIVGKKSSRGLNENLAREVLELHSLGVDGGYTQQDVTALAKILTGWTVDLDRKSPDCGTTIFDRRRHEPGAKSLLGFTIEASGRGELVDAVKIIAAHRSTARNVARRLIVGFLSDEAPADAVEALEQRFISSGGQLRDVTEELISIDSMWTSAPLKMRSPIELLFITDRLIGETPRPPQLRVSLAAMGQPFLQAPSPKGWTEDNRGWISSDGIKSRLDWAAAIGARFGDRLDGIAWQEAARSGRLSVDSADAVRRAETKSQALALLLMSPEVQRR